MTLQEVKEKIAINIVELFKQVLMSEHSINEKSNTTLEHTHLFEDANVVNSGDYVFDLLYNDYLQYIESGRKPFAKKVPIQALDQWALEKIGDNSNSTLFAIQNSIYYTGIKARPILIYLEQELDRAWDETWSDDLYGGITDILDEYFNS